MNDVLGAPVMPSKTATAVAKNGRDFRDGVIGRTEAELQDSGERLPLPHVERQHPSRDFNAAPAYPGRLPHENFERIGRAMEVKRGTQ